MAKQRSLQDHAFEFNAMTKRRNADLHEIVGTEISASTATPECLCRMVQLLRMQIEPAPPDNDVGGHVRRKQGLPPLREALLFRAFVFGEYPFQGDVEESGEDGSDSADDEAVI